MVRRMAAARYYERVEKRLLCNSDGVVCISQGFARLATEWGVDPSRTFMIENWAPLARCCPLQRTTHGLENMALPIGSASCIAGRWA